MANARKRRSYGFAFANVVAGTFFWLQGDRAETVTKSDLLRDGTDDAALDIIGS